MHSICPILLAEHPSGLLPCKMYCMTTVAVMVHPASFEVSHGSSFQSHMEDLNRIVGGKS